MLRMRPGPPTCCTSGSLQCERANTSCRADTSAPSFIQGPPHTPFFPLSATKRKLEKGKPAENLLRESHLSGIHSVFVHGVRGNTTGPKLRCTSEGVV